EAADEAIHSFMDHGDEFLSLHANSRFPHAEELISLLRGGMFISILRSDGSLCRHYADVYQRRAELVVGLRKSNYIDKQSYSEMQAEFVAIAKSLSRTPNAP